MVNEDYEIFQTSELIMIHTGWAKLNGTNLHFCL